eukprot:gene26781-32907_t
MPAEEVVIEIPEADIFESQAEPEIFLSTQPQASSSLSSAGPLSMLRKIYKAVRHIPSNFSTYADTIANKVVAKISARIDKLEVSNVSNASLDKSKKPLLEMNLQSSKTLAELIRVFDLQIDVDSGTCACRLCRLNCNFAQETASKIFPGGNRDKFGIFTLPEGADLRPFKTVLRKHFESAAHSWCAEYDAWTQLQQSRYAKVGLILARNAYFIIREALSYLCFERLVHEDHCKGLQVGTLNHSTAFISEFMVHMHSVLKDKIVLFLDTVDPATGQRPVYAINADKVTELRRTGQIVGMLVMVEGVIKAIFLGDPPVTQGHDAKGVCKNILVVLVDIFGFTAESMQAQCSGMAFDGAYFKLHAEEALCVALEVDLDWILPNWDGAHKLEK